MRQVLTASELAETFGLTKYKVYEAISRGELTPDVTCGPIKGFYISRLPRLLDLLGGRISAFEYASAQAKLAEFSTLTTNTMTPKHSMFQTSSSLSSTANPHSATRENKIARFTGTVQPAAGPAEEQPAPPRDLSALSEPQQRARRSHPLYNSFKTPPGLSGTSREVLVRYWNTIRQNENVPVRATRFRRAHASDLREAFAEASLIDPNYARF